MLKALRRHWLLALLTTLIAMGGVLGALATVPKAYTATAVIALSPRPEGRLSGDLLRLTIPSYASLATSPSVAQDLARRFDQDPDAVRNAISVENPPASNTMLLSVTWPDPEMAAQLANGLADQVVEASANDQLLSGSFAAVGVPPSEPSWPPQPASLILGSLLAVLLGLAAAWLADRRWSRVSSPATLVGMVERGGLPVPVITVGSSVAGAGAYVVRALAGALAAPPAAGARIEVVEVGPLSPRTIALTMSTAAALAQQGSRVHVSLRESDKGLIWQEDIDDALLFTGTGTVTWGFSDMPAPAGTAAKSRAPRAPQILVRVTGGAERIGAWGTEKSLAGVVPVVSADTPETDAEAALTALRELDAPVLAVCYLLPMPKSRAPSTA